MLVRQLISTGARLRAPAFRWLFALALAASSIVTLPPRQTPAALADSAPRLRIGVTRDGITLITPGDLQSAGIDPASVDPRAFAMTSLGAPVAIEVTGEADGRFDPGDQLLFFGQKFRGPEMDQKYTDERVYWLEMGGPAGPRIASVSAAPAGSAATPESVLTTWRAEQSILWWTLHSLGFDTQDTWFWARLQPGANPGDSVNRDLPFTVPDPAPATAATLRVEELARYNSNSSNFYHRTTLAVNGTSVGSYDWQGRIRVVHTATVPAGALSGNTTTVTVGAINRPDKGTVYDDIYVNYWELDYRRLFRAWEGQFDFVTESAGPRDYAVDSWAGSGVGIWDVSAPAAPVRLLGATFSTTVLGQKARFRADGPAGRRYWLQDAATYRSPASIRLLQDTGLRAPAGGADVVIVTHTTLLPAAEALADWHRAHGRRALVVDAQDAYDEFNYGIYHPKAIPALLKWARANWSQPGPSYLTLIGDGHWNFKAFNTAVYPAPPIMIPPFLAWVDPWQGEVPADTLFGELTGDAVPEVAVGRLVVNTLDEALTVVGKITSYDESARLAGWQQQALFVADNNDGVDFAGSSDAAIAHLPSDIAPEKVYLGITHPDAASAKGAIAAAINDGALMVQYGGHGATWRWTEEAIWTVSDVSGLANGARLPVVVTFNCLDGYFAHPDPAQQSIAETMQRRAGGGSVAAISPSGLGTQADQQNFRLILMDILFEQGTRELGLALQQAKQQFAALYGDNYLLYTQSLYGDPALRLPGFAAAVPQAPRLGIAADGVDVALSWSAVERDIYERPLVVSGYEIWRSAIPYFAPGQPDCACEQVATTTGLEWSDDNRLGNSEASHYWLVRAASGEYVSAGSNHVGEFEYALTR